MPVTASQLFNAYAHRFAGNLDVEPVIGIPHAVWLDLACEFNAQHQSISAGVTSGGKHFPDAIPVPRAVGPDGVATRLVWFYPVI